MTSLPVTTILIIISVSFTIIFALPVEIPSSSSSSQPPPLESKIIDLTDDTFEKTLQLSNRNTNNDVKVHEDWLIMFHSPNCGGCLMVSPAIENFGSNMFKKGEHKVRVAKVNCNQETDEGKLSMQTCKRFKIRRLPTLIFIENSAKGNSVYNFFNYRNEQLISSDAILAFVQNPQKAIRDEIDERRRKLHHKNGNNNNNQLTATTTTTHHEQELLEQDIKRLLRFAQPWPKDAIPPEIRTIEDEVRFFIETANEDFRQLTGNRVSPIVFWIFVIFCVFALITILVVNLCVDSSKWRRKTVSQVLAEKKRLVEAQKKNN